MYLFCNVLQIAMKKILTNKKIENMRIDYIQK